MTDDATKEAGANNHHKKPKEKHTNTPTQTLTHLLTFTYQASINNIVILQDTYSYYSSDLLKQV